jgi:hypothetical protein
MEWTMELKLGVKETAKPTNEQINMAENCNEGSFTANDDDYILLKKYLDIADSLSAS